MDFWAIVTDLGGLVGLATGAFVVWDRIFKDRPTAYFVAAPLGGIGRRSVYLRVKNLRERPIFVGMQSGTAPGMFVVAFDHSTESIVSSLFHGERTLVLDGGKSVDLPVMEPSGFEELPPYSKIKVALCWRYAQTQLLPIRREIGAAILKQDYETLEEGKSRRFEDE
jgi:hypothetical protein